jgi:hypothetical protein
VGFGANDLVAQVEWLVRLAGHRAIRQPLSASRRQLLQGRLRQPPLLFFVSEPRTILHIAHGVCPSCRRNPCHTGTEQRADDQRTGEKAHAVIVSHERDIWVRPGKDDVS